jgi:hypothetical protein
MAGFKSERRPASSWNSWPGSSEYAAPNFLTLARHGTLALPARLRQNTKLRWIAMKTKSLRVAAILALGLGTMTAHAAMPVAPTPPKKDLGIIHTACSYGWYRGPDGQCYIAGTGPRYYRRRYYHDRGYYPQPRQWNNSDDRFRRPRNPENDQYR